MLYIVNFHVICQLYLNKNKHLDKINEETKMMRQPAAVECPSLAQEENVSWQHSWVPAIDWTCPAINHALQGYRANDSNNN